MEITRHVIYYSSATVDVTTYTHALITSNMDITYVDMVCKSFGRGDCMVAPVNDQHQDKVMFEPSVLFLPAT